ncbi:hypothetical protein AMK21_29515 [Streptomyces sp. CB00316]|uniref:aldehyde dehydrogenase family protein n=1 Tax=Streptomyces sp. CB00316 TaxID=1703932 RepID=UPI00093BFF67|nr:aldehyde dehydrogenase family protein [Streptomyces sp. CB00316]OKJ12049.1 hypothetical protein AMK21_29515 [Streptomyces sp. CB00316]
MSEQRKNPFATVDPYTGETLAEFPAIEGAEVDAVLETAGDAFDAWRKRSIEERAALVGRVAGLMKERKETLARLITLEMGKLISEARGEVDLAASVLAYYAEHGPAFAAREPLDVEGGEAYLVNEPLGVLLGVMPWNFPLYQVVRFAGPNLVLGNTVLVKHAGICPQSALALEVLFRDVGAPEGVYTNLFVSHDEISRIIDSPVVKGASLTGSERAGARVAERAGRKGMVWVNHPTSTQPDLPFGGIRRSGYGRELSKLGMQEFVNRKLVRVLPPDAELSGIAG